jgi:hypothetical protein
MNIGLLSKRKTMMAGKLKDWFDEKGNIVTIYTLENLVINESLLNHDFYILKSKNLFFLYAGFFLEENNKIVIPHPNHSFKQKNRIQSHFVLKKAGLLPPKIFLGTAETLKDQLNPNSYPYILKPIMGSGSKGVKIIRSPEDFETINNSVLYIEKYIKGIHYNVYFIDKYICTLIKPPLADEHVNMKKIDTPEDIKESINKWRAYFKGDVLFGHLDMVREDSTNKLYVVDPGSFPEFSNWKCEISPAEVICNLIINKYKDMRKNQMVK